ncbi:MAG: tyrosine--tRNA ligase [Rhizobiales bacterium]|nr:tyrosine--tRNA ligase [Hyphomicrobiales bacterium]
MSTYKSDFLNILSSRGYIHQCSDAAGLDALAAKGDVTAYIGFDCTAPSLHVGSLVQIMLLHWLQQTGNKPIVLMGGGTTRVGDPSGRDESRKILSIEDIENNKQGIQAVFAKFLAFGSGKTDATMVDNAEWLTKLNYIEMLRDIGKHFSVNRMLAMDSVKLRLEREHELSFIEFNYMILQAYDFTELSRRYGCNLQMGGSDQWGNIVNGIDLGRRMGTPQLYALTTPLITLASGAKMGKTASGAVWLNADMRSPYEYWQFWRNTEDADVGRFLRLFTTLPLPEVARLEALQGSEINEAKKVLANAATALLHGEAAAAEAAETARKTFEEGASAGGLPTVTVDLGSGIGVLAAMVQAGLASSNGEARRAIQGGGIRINDDVVKDDKLLLTSALAKDGSIKLSHGKKKHVLLKQG